MKKLFFGAALVIGGIVTVWLSPIGLLDIAGAAGSAVGGFMVGKNWIFNIRSFPSTA